MMQFNRQQPTATATAPAAAPTATGAPARAPGRSAYAGVSGADQRDPMAELGTYRMRVIACAEGHNPGTRRDSYKVTLRVEDAAEGSLTPVGTVCTTVALFTSAGLSELKRFAFHAAGFGPTLEQRQSEPTVAKRLAAEGEAKYNELEESNFGYQGAILEASAGHANGAPSLVGRLVDVCVTRGKDVINKQTGAPTGDYYRNYTWGVVPEEEQTAA